MTYYKVHYRDSVHTGISFRLVEGYNRKHVFSVAQAFAQERKTPVTIIAETGGANGLDIKVYEIKPTGEITS